MTQVFEVGQVWEMSCLGIGGTMGKRIVDLDQRGRVLLLKTARLPGSHVIWESAVLFTDWIEKTGATLKAKETR